MIVADASIILKWVLPDEPDGERALVLRDRHLSGESLIAVPEMLFYELANVLPRRLTNIGKATELFCEICAVQMESRSFEQIHFAHSMGLSHRFGISSYDASYVVLAQTLRCPFVTADERLLARLKGAPHVLHLTEVVR